MDASRIGSGQRTTEVPMRRQKRIRMARLGSSRPNRLAMVIIAGPRVSATATAVSMPTAHGTPRLWKYGIRVRDRQNAAPAMVSAEPRMTCAVPPNIS